MKKLKASLEQVQRDMIHLTSFKTHPKILTARIFSLSFLNLITSIYRSAAWDNSDAVFQTITFYMQRIEKLSQKNIALRIIEHNLNSLRHNEKLSKFDFEKKIKDIIKYLRDSLK